MPDLATEIAEHSADLTKFVIEQGAPYGFILVEADQEPGQLEARQVLIVIAFDKAALRLNDLMSLSLEVD